MKLLVLGSSSISFAGDGPSQAEVIEEELRARDPARDWRCVARNLFLAPSMARHARDLGERESPDAAFLYLDAAQVMTDSVVYRFRSLAPSIYPAAMALAVKLERATGGKKSTTAMRRAYEALRAAIASLIGVRPDVSIEDAVRWTEETVASLAQVESLALLATLPVAWYPQYTARIERYRAAVSALASRHRIPLCEADGGVHWDIARSAYDSSHVSIAQRRQRAETYVPFILASVPRDR